VDAAFITSAATHHTCLCLRLEPLTLGHLFLLRECDVDFDALATSDLVMGVFICSGSHTQARKNLRAWWSKYFMMLLGFICRKLKPAEEAEKFYEYLEDGLRAPTMHSFKNGPARMLSAPDEWRMLVMLEVDFHKSKADALDMTMREIYCRWATEADRQGSQSIMSDDEREFWEHARKCDRERFAHEQN
jgi:hypothetical protein